MKQLEQYLTVKEAARFLGVAENTLRNWDREAKIPVFRHPISNYRLFKRQDLEKVLEQIEETGKYPTGWRQSMRSKRKPR